MGKFYLHRGNKLVATGLCPDGDEPLQAIDGMEYGLGDPPPEIVPEIIEIAPSYDQLRAREYPTLGDQLDALWKLLGPTAPKGSDAAQVFQAIQNVKQRHPKPGP